MNSIPMVVIMGRPNVGKSTFFNRIAGDRIAVISDIAGVTRDRVSADAEWRGKRYIAVDTGGVTDDKEIPLWEQIREQTKTALEQADIVIQVVDAQDGLTTEDIEAANLARRYAKPTVVVANKADNRRTLMNVGEFYSLGFDTVVGVSALHGSGIEDTLQAALGDTPPQQEETTPTAEIRVAIVGRPNVGKSALFNAIIGDNRSIVSTVAGTTRDTIDTSLSYNSNDFLFMDTAGIRRRGKVATGVEKYSVLRSFAAMERAEVCVIMLNAEEFVTAQDTHVAGFASSALRASVLVLNKWDLAPKLKLDIPSAQEPINEQLKFLSEPPLVFTSALKKEGVGELLDTIIATRQEYRKEVDNASLNDCISEAVGRNPPPRRHGYKINILGVKQEHRAPPVFVFDATNAEHLHFSYRRYLESNLRKQFGFNGVPIVMRFRNPHRRKR